MARWKRRGHKARELTMREFLNVWMIFEPGCNFASDEERAVKFQQVADEAERMGELGKTKQLRAYIAEFPTVAAARNITPERDELYSSMRAWT